MPDWDHDHGYGPPPQVRAAWQLEHMAAAVAAASATSNAIANAQAQVQAQANVHAALIAALDQHLTTVLTLCAANPAAVQEIEAAISLVAQL